ncbi:MAG TPA: hypothetical protein VGB37_06380 [Candidatus Lokiarchaeia archaeon]
MEKIIKKISNWFHKECIKEKKRWEIVAHDWYEECLKQKKKIERLEQKNQEQLYRIIELNEAVKRYTEK